MPALLLGAALLGAVPAGAQPEPAEAREAARAVLADPGYQRELPEHPGLADAEPPGGGESVFGSGGSAAILPVLGAGALLSKIIFIVLLIVAALLVVGWLARELIRRGRRASEAGGAEPPASVSGHEPIFEDAARLAAEGRYAEAIHVLLLTAIRHFAERSRVPVQPSRTSRELIRLLPLAADAREAFAELVRAVELSLFGGEPAGREEYERSLFRFRALTRRPA